MEEFYACPDNHLKFWTPGHGSPRRSQACPHMLALPAQCVAFCVSHRQTPADLYKHVNHLLESSPIDPAAYNLIMDWCSVASQAGTGTNTSSSVLSFTMPAILGTTDHLHEWAHKRLAITLGPKTTKPGQTENSQTLNGTSQRQGPQREAVDVTMLAQVTTAVVAAIRAGEGQQMEHRFLLCSLVIKHTPIWEYFKTTKDVDAQRTQLLETMRGWARDHDVQINRSLYFDKSTLDDIARLDFCPGTPTAFLSTAEQGISLLICRPCTGNETADIRSHEQAIKVTSSNHTLAKALLLSKRDPRQPAATYHELKFDLGTFCALLGALFGNTSNYFENCYSLWTMLDSESVFANANYFTALIYRQITWAVINDS
jgi:hypothetical protein